VLVAVLVAIAQRRALRKFVSVAWTRVIVAAVAFPVAFWLGYYQPWITGPDTDILAGFLVLGSAVWIGHVPAKRHPVAATTAILSFPVASFVAELCLLIVFTVLHITPALQTSELQHSIFWITVGGITGILGGWISALAIARMLTTELQQRAA
jgi:hypothetical protein